jgi:hypothetical protein
MATETVWLQRQLINSIWYVHVVLDHDAQTAEVLLHDSLHFRRDVERHPRNVTGTYIEIEDSTRNLIGLRVKMIGQHKPFEDTRHYRVTNVKHVFTYPKLPQPA